jgi:hypothetical protein
LSSFTLGDEGGGEMNTVVRMKIADLKKFDLIYVGTPYTKYPGGTDEAFIDACKLAARLVRLGLKIYSSIAHTHPLAIYGELDPLDLAIWLPFDAAMIGKSDAMLVAMMAGWETSTGIRHEIQAFTEAGKPVFFLAPAALAKVEAAARSLLIRAAEGG